MRTPGAFMAVGSLLLLTAPAAYAEPVRPGEEPTFDLGILPPDTPEVLKQAAIAPYVAPAGSDCEAVAREIAALDSVLGPDADAPKKGGPSAGRVVGQAVKSLIPYRSVVRLVTGADRKQRQRDQAAMAGWARRGYLKGLQASQGCAGGAAAPMTASVPASEPVPAPTAQAAPTMAESQPPVRLGHVEQTQPAVVETAFSR